MKFKQKSLGSHVVRQEGLGFLEEEKIIKRTVEKHGCKLYLYELYLYLKYRICVINNKRKGGLYTGGLYSGGKTRY